MKAYENKTKEMFGISADNELLYKISNKHGNICFLSVRNEDSDFVVITENLKKQKIRAFYLKDSFKIVI